MEATGEQNTCYFNEGVSKRSSRISSHVVVGGGLQKILLFIPVFYAVGRSSVWPFLSTLDVSTATKRKCAVMFAWAILYSWNPLGVEFHLTHESTSMRLLHLSGKMVLFSSYARDVVCVPSNSWAFWQGSCSAKVDNITHLDLRGNRLNAAFGWKLIKAIETFWTLKLSIWTGGFGGFPE